MKKKKKIPKKKRKNKRKNTPFSRFFEKPFVEKKK